MIPACDLRELAEVSARIGGNPLLVQGAGGNSSIKNDDELWVKASGTWLAEACERDIFVPLSRSRVDRDLREQGLISAHAILADRGDEGLRPSIETALHALMPQRVVLHAHAVNAMALSVQADGETITARLLGDTCRWRWIPYRQPGSPLAAAVRDALAQAPADVLLLQNHGVVVGADTPAAAEALLQDVERRLHMEPRTFPDPPLIAPAGFEDDAYELHRAASGAALDPAAVALLTGQALIPDQVVFLGGAVPALPEGEIPSRHAAALKQRIGVSPALLLLPGRAAFAARQRSTGTEDVIQGLLAIARRVPPGARVTGLANEDVGALLNWDAEHYRLALDSARAAR